ncbi:MAG TPA: hypothetical protein VN930_09150 [Xanthobacteraceae bacterium]|nr:hypothetical protein [Xanthobacteraceae bacterium]
MRYLLGVAAAVALIVGAGSAGAAVVKPAGLAAAAVDLGSLELVARKGRAHGAAFCVACPIPMPVMNKTCVGSMQSCMAANPLCYVTSGACAAGPVAAPAKAKKARKAKKAGKKKMEKKEPAAKKEPAKKEPAKKEPAKKDKKK